MTKIPYIFKAIPDEFLTDDFIEDTLMMKIVREIMIRVRAESHIYEFICNSKKVSLNLNPFEFSFGRLALAKKLNVSEDAIRTRMNKLYNLKYAERYPKKPTSRSTGSSPGISPSSYINFSTSSYSVCRLCVENFKTIKQEINHQQVMPETHQQVNRQFTRNFPHKEEEEEYKEIKEQQQQQQAGSSNEKIISILEGWDFERDLRPLSLTIVKEESSNNNIHYRTLNITDSELSDANFIEFVIEYAAACGFSKSTLLELQRKKYSIERVFLGIYKLQGRTDIRSTRAVLLKICEDEDFQELKTIKSKKRRITKIPNGIEKTESKSEYQYRFDNHGT